MMSDLRRGSGGGVLDSTGSKLTHLEGSLSGRSYDPDQALTVDPSDGRPLLARYDLASVVTDRYRNFGPRATGTGLWQWHELLPVKDWSNVINLGEGGTPLLPARRLSAALRTPGLLIKAESLNPTGSFKARGMAVAVSRALELGVRRLVAPSAGNAGGALAAYAAAAGIRATVIMPADAPHANKAEVVVAGAELILVNGLISDCGRLASRFSEATQAFDVSTLKEPYRLEGKKTMGYELAAQLKWLLPDVIVYPTGGGTGLIGMWKAFDELESLGLIGAARPRMVSVQAEGCAPIVRAVRAGERFAKPVEAATTAAAGLRVPGSLGDFLITDAIKRSHGTALAIPESEIVSMQHFAGRHGMGHTSLESAAALAAIPQLIDHSIIENHDRVVVFDTGAGFKSADPSLPALEPLRADGSDWERVLLRSS